MGQPTIHKFNLSDLTGLYFRRLVTFEPRAIAHRLSKIRRPLRVLASKNVLEPGESPCILAWVMDAVPEIGPSTFVSELVILIVLRLLTPPIIIPDAGQLVHGNLTLPVN